MSGRQRGFWSTLFGGGGRAHDRFSLQELQYLHSVLLRNPVVTDANRDTVVEALRSIAELVIWGDQHDSSMVEYFLTENLLAHFNQILQQRSNRRGNVAMQVLQTLSILIQNLRTQQTVYYLFSNNHINEIVSMRFDFEDDEVLGYFVNLLKAISLKLNEVTVQFFFQAPGPRPGASPGAPPGTPRPASFPLYTESIKFVNHRDPMVRTAVKTLTLNVYAIPLPAVQQFVTSRPAAAYFAELATYISELCQVLDRLLSSWDVSSPQSQGAVESCLAEVEDLLSYCNDVLATGVPALRALLLDCLWQAFVGPVLFWPLIQEDVAAQHIAALTLLAGNAGAGAATAAGSGAAGPGSGGRGWGPADAKGARTVQRGSVGPLCSLYVFERLFRAVTDEQLLAVLVSALLGGSAVGSPGNSGGSSVATSRPASPNGQPAAGGPAVALQWQVPQELMIRLQYSPAAYRQALLGMLRGTDAQVAAAAVRVLACLLQSRAASEEQLELIGLLSQRRRKQRQLLQALVGDSPTSSQLLEPAVVAEAAARQSSRRQQQQQERLEPAPAADSLPACNGKQHLDSSTSSSKNGSGAGEGSGPSSSSSSSSRDGSNAGHVRLSFEESPDGSLAVRLRPSTGQRQVAEQQPPGRGSPPQQEAYQPLEPQQQQQQQVQLPLPSQQHQHQHQPPFPQQQQHAQRRQQGAAPAAYAEHAFGEVVGCLLGLLGSDLLPPLCLTTLGWLLHQLLSVGKGGAPLSDAQREALAEAAARQRAALQQQLQGPWCDALAPMVAAGWGRSRQAILRSGPGSVHVAVQTWMQAVLVQELHWQQGTSAASAAAAAAGSGPAGSSPDAASVAAKQAYLCVEAALAVLQTQQGLCEGDIPLSPPCPPVSESDVRAGEVREAAQIGLASSQLMNCTVCFSRGQERAACFAVEGLPAHVKAGAALDLALAKASVLQQVAASAPVCVVAGPGSKPETGLVLSVAPLMGAQPRQDDNHPRWLHIQVRPPLRGLLKVLQGSHPGNALLNMQKHLVSGHWVLSFPDGDRAASAQQHVEEWAHKMRALYCQLLHPLLHEEQAGGDCHSRSITPQDDEAGGKPDTAA